MVEEKENIPRVEKQSQAVGVPFRVKSKTPQVTWRTNYSYYLAQKAKKGSVRPLIGRYNTTDGKDQFQIYDGLAKMWVDANFWDYAEAVVDETGKAVMNKFGKPKNKPYFEEKHDWLIEFVEDTPVQYYNSELKQTVTERRKTIYIRLSKSLSAKLQEQLDDERNGENPKFILNYDTKKMPAEQYSFKYVK